MNGGVEFKQPSFFAPQRDHDASSLADLLSQSFTLGQDQQDHVEDTIEQGVLNSPSTVAGQHARRSDAQSTILMILLSCWLLTMFVPMQFSWELQLTTLFAAGVIALRATGDTSSIVSSSTPGPAVYILSALGVAELAAICWIGSEIWSGESAPVEWYGVGVLASMLGHQALGRVM